jgi:hypothetical protein
MIIDAMRYVKERTGGVSATGGFIIPLIFAAYGAYCIQDREALFPEGWNWLHFSGADAVATGIVFISLAFLLNCHFFLSRLTGIWWLGRLFQALGLLVFLASFGYAAWRAVAHMML